MMKGPGTERLPPDCVGEYVLRLDPGCIDGEDVGARDRHDAAEFGESAAVAVGNRRVESIMDRSGADLPEPCAVARHLVGHDHQKVVQWQVECEPLAESI